MFNIDLWIFLCGGDAPRPTHFRHDLITEPVVRDFQVKTVLIAPESQPLLHVLSRPEFGPQTESALFAIVQSKAITVDGKYHL